MRDDAPLKDAPETRLAWGVPAMLLVSLAAIVVYDRGREERM